MIGITIFDLYLMGYKIHFFIWNKLQSGPCTPPTSYLLSKLGFVADSFADDCMRCTAFLGLSMALIRVIVLKNPIGIKSERFQNISQWQFGWRTNTFIFLFSSIISILYWLRFKIEILFHWTPPETGCQGKFPENYTLPSYYLDVSDLGLWNDAVYSKAFILIDGMISKVLPAILFPVLTFILVAQFRIIRENHERLSQQSDQNFQRSSLTTKLVICMAISYMINVLPLGLLYLLQYTCAEMDCEIGFVNYMLAAGVFSTVTTVSHLPICVFISQQYRWTLKELLGIGITKVQANLSSTSSNMINRMN
ncbi:unnamed protein product [Caenorhabditis nigoni]